MRVDVIVVTTGLLQRLRHSETLSRPKLESSDESLRFVHITRPETTIRVLYSEIPVRFARIYPNYGQVDLLSIQDSTFYDLDPDYELQHLFGQQQCTVYAIIQELLQESNKRGLMDMYSMFPNKQARIDVGNTTLDNSGILMISQESSSQKTPASHHLPTDKASSAPEDVERYETLFSSAVVPAQMSSPVLKALLPRAEQNTGSQEKQPPAIAGESRLYALVAVPKNKQVSEGQSFAGPVSSVPSSTAIAPIREALFPSSNQHQVNRSSLEIDSTGTASSVTTKAVSTESPVKTPKRRGPKPKSTNSAVSSMEKTVSEVSQPIGATQAAAVTTVGLISTPTNGQSAQKPKGLYKKVVAAETLKEASALPVTETTQGNEQMEQLSQVDSVKSVPRNETVPQEPNNTTSVLVANQNQAPEFSQNASQSGVGTHANSVPRVGSVPQPVLPLRLSRAAAQDAHRKLKEQVLRDATGNSEHFEGSSSISSSRHVSFADVVRAQEQALLLATRRPLRGSSTASSKYTVAEAN